MSQKSLTLGAAKCAHPDYPRQIRGCLEVHSCSELQPRRFAVAALQWHSAIRCVSERKGSSSIALLRSTQRINMIKLQLKVLKVQLKVLETGNGCVRSWLMVSPIDVNFFYKETMCHKGLLD